MVRLRRCPEEFIPSAERAGNNSEQREESRHSPSILLLKAHPMESRRRQTRTKAEPVLVPAGIISAITASPRAAGRFDILIDRVPVARLAIQGIEKLGLRVGMEVDELFGAKIAAEATVSRAYDRAMMMLAARGRASGELRRLLIRKGEEAGVVSEVIERLTTAGFLDDDAFARQFTRAKAGAGSMSKRRIEQELGRRGIDRGAAREAVAETFAEEGVDEESSIQAVAEKKLRTLSKVDDQTRRRRLYGFLARRGFDVDAIREVVARLTKEPAEPTE
jgi:regulatory protein